VGQVENLRADCSIGARGASRAVAEWNQAEDAIFRSREL